MSSIQCIPHQEDPYLSFIFNTLLNNISQKIALIYWTVPFFKVERIKGSEVLNIWYYTIYVHYNQVYFTTKIFVIFNSKHHVLKYHIMVHSKLYQNQYIEANPMLLTTIRKENPRANIIECKTTALVFLWKQRHTITVILILKYCWELVIVIVTIILNKLLNGVSRLCRMYPITIVLFLFSGMFS